jgi:dinuclear metal center YbgI/SA1388 family protein
MTIYDLIHVIEEFAPPGLQESYDNAGLIVGDGEKEVISVLCTIDVTEEVIDEAIGLNANLIISHHPVIFTSLKSITGKNTVERVILKSLKNDIALYSAHTNLDNAFNGVNRTIADKLSLENTLVLSPLRNQLLKLVTFVPGDHAGKVRMAIFNAGAGHIGNYDQCSYNLEGNGSFRGGENTNPFKGKKGKIHFEPEVRIETIVPRFRLGAVLNALLKNHPYEEAAYDLYPVENEFKLAGAGLIGKLPEPLSADEFLESLHSAFNIPVIKYSGNNRQKIAKVAVCGGSGSFLLNRAISAGANAFITADIKYHQYFEAEDKILYCDIGHYESEQFTKEIFYSLLTKKLSKFAVHLSEIETNPVKYHF